MRSKTFTIGDYEVTMVVPKHGKIAEAEKESLDSNSFGVPFVNQSKMRHNTLVLSLASVKNKDGTEVVTDQASADRFITDELDDDLYEFLWQVYSKMTDIRRYGEVIKNLGLEDNPQ